MNKLKNILLTVFPRAKKEAPNEILCRRTAALVFLSFVLIGMYTVYAVGSIGSLHIANILWTLLWSLLFTLVIIVLPSPLARLVYGVLYSVLTLYGVSQYVYFKIFNKLFSFTVLSNINEGARYIGSVLSVMQPTKVLCFIALLVFGAAVWARLPRISKFPVRKNLYVLPAAIALLLASQVYLPDIYGDKVERAVWNSFADPRYIYDSYTDPHKCVGLCGYYQWLAHDFYNCFIRPLSTDVGVLEDEIAQFFEDYPCSHEDNDMTGILKGKNVIMIMLESMDYMAITDGNTPTIDMMRENGIDFTNYYSSIFGDGATFSNEFVLNTGIYSPSNGSAAYSYNGNSFTYSLPNLFKSAGYSANSFHKNYGWFYNRELMHSALGYEHYYSFFDYGATKESADIDTFLTDNERLMDMLFDDSKKPFFNFLITYSAHLPYTYDDEIYKIAYEKYCTDGEQPDTAEDIACLRVKARITDDMLRALVDAADENTVFICVTDHFAYGLEEQTLSETKSTEWTLRQNTPFFIYCKDPALAEYACTVDKLCSNADFLPTIANLFGLDIPVNIMGHDIFDDEYDGWVVFSNYAWLTDDAYWHDEVVVSENGCTEELIRKMTEYTYRRIKTNDSLLASDYYRRAK